MKVLLCIFIADFLFISLAINNNLSHLFFLQPQNYLFIKKRRSVRKDTTPKGHTFAVLAAAIVVALATAAVRITVTAASKNQDENNHPRAVVTTK